MRTDTARFPSIREMWISVPLGKGFQWNAAGQWMRAMGTLAPRLERRVCEDVFACGSCRFRRTVNLGSLECWGEVAGVLRAVS